VNTGQMRTSAEGICNTAAALSFHSWIERLLAVTMGTYSDSLPSCSSRPSMFTGLVPPARKPLPWNPAANPMPRRGSASSWKRSMRSWSSS